jgi:hypothetical protein
MSDVLIPPGATSQPASAAPFADPAVPSIAEHVLRTLELAFDAGIAGRVLPQEFPLPEDPNAFEHIAAKVFDVMSPNARERLSRDVLTSLQASRETRRRKLGALADIDVRSRVAVEAQARAFAPTAVDPRRLHPAGRDLPSPTQVLGGAQAPAGPLTPKFDNPDAIKAKYKKLGGAKGPLGAATGAQRLEKDAKGRGVEVRRYEHGIIVRSSKAEAFAVYGKTYARYKAEGEIRSRFGPPITDTTMIDGLEAVDGVVTHFHDGYSLYATTVAPVHEVHGAIRKRYQQLGAETGALGLPVSDEHTVPDVPQGCFSRFQGGEIRWHPKHGAQAMPNPVAELRARTRMLAYPTTTPASFSSAEYRFEGGLIRTKGLKPVGPPMLPLTAVELVLRRVQILRMPALESLKAELLVGGTRIDADGTVSQVKTHILGDFKEDKKTRDFDRVLARYDLTDTVATWPAALAFIVGFIENEKLLGSSNDFISDVTSKVRDKVEQLVQKEVEEGIDALVEKIANEYLGGIVSEVLGQLAGWVLDKLWDKLEQAWKDDPLRPVPVSLRLPHAFIGNGAKPGTRLGKPDTFETRGVDGIKIRATVEWRVA